MLKYKTQPDKNQPIDSSRLLAAVKVALFNQIFISTPTSIAIFYIRQHLGASCHPDKLPTLLIVLLDLAIFTLVEEIGFYYTHRFVHWGPLYKSIHKKHHEWTAPVGVVSIYAHPVEYALSNVMPLVLGPTLMTSHLLTTWIWFTMAVMTTIIHHSGYHLPFFPSNEFHDFHHLKFTCNYGLTGWLDYLHGTDKLYSNTVQKRRDHINFNVRPLAWSTRTDSDSNAASNKRSN